MTPVVLTTRGSDWDEHNLSLVGTALGDDAGKPTNDANA